MNKTLKEILIMAAIIIIPVLIFTYFFISMEMVSIKNGYITFKNVEKEKVGQIWANEDNLTIYGYNGRNVEIGAGNGIIINAGGGSVEIRQGNDTKIKISNDRIDINTDNLFINGKQYGN